MHVIVSRKDHKREGGFIIAAGSASLAKEGLGMLPRSLQCTLAG